MWEFFSNLKSLITASRKSDKFSLTPFPKMRNRNPLEPQKKKKNPIQKGNRDNSNWKNLETKSPNWVQTHEGNRQ
ncbi:hypothetical protein RJT34_26496 [Clitoria ternatea]|uniref:Uncharacterized protein n=1 Tax=Clitoria ternatea TaxID=43366 RepID=A0AAN9F8Z9_CLITE